jgi:hypothetical protein
MIEAKLIKSKLDFIYPIITLISNKQFAAKWIMHPYSKSHIHGSITHQFQIFFHLH